MTDEVILSGTAYSFKRLDNGSWLWTVQLCEAPDHFQVGISATKDEADVEAAATGRALRRLSVKARDIKLDRLAA